MSVAGHARNLRISRYFSCCVWRQVHTDRTCQSMQIPATVEQRMESFVTSFGDVPATARKLQDYDARNHRDMWVQRLLGEGIVCHYVIGYTVEDQWWTFCFDRNDEASIEGEEERWIVESYDSLGGSWRHSFTYDVSLGLWRR